MWRYLDDPYFKFCSGRRYVGCLHHRHWFEDRTIPLLTYNVETLLAKKIQTILTRGIANTRLRDYYDVYEIMKICAARVDKNILFQAFYATCKKRETVFSKDEMSETLAIIEKDAGMAGMWEQFRKKNYFVGNLEWKEVLNGVLDVIYINHLWRK